MTWKYKINGHTYIFVDVVFRDGCYVGYSNKRKKWAKLFNNHIDFYGEPTIFATRIS